MRSKALSFLLSLSLMFCVGFGSSITASAADVSPDAKNQWFLLPFNDLSQGSVNTEGVFDSYSGTYNGSITGGPSSSWPTFTTTDIGGVFPVLESGHTYLLYYTVSLYTPSSVDLDRLVIRSDLNDSSTKTIRPTNLLYSTQVYVNSTSTMSGVYQFSLNQDIVLNTGSGIFYKLTSDVSVSGRSTWAFYVLDITDNTDSDVNQIVAAIQDQTSDLQQSIEDQYGGDPGSSFPVDDIITQHNDKMGVLSFSSEALMQVLGLLSPDQTLSSELVFPSMSLTIAGQRNKVQLWPEYRFDLNTLKQHWPDFVGLMQSLTTALVWIFVLRYCYRVFEKYFLAGGGN